MPSLPLADVGIMLYNSFNLSLTPNSEMEMRHLPFQTKVNNNKRAFIKSFENLI